MIEALSRAKLKWQHIHPIILLYGCLSSHSTLQLVFYRRCGGSSHTPVDRAGGVKSECLTSLILWSYGISSLAHARYRYTTHTQGKRMIVISDPLLSFSACLLITPPSNLNQQFSTHDHMQFVVFATVNSLDNTTARLTVSCKFSQLLCE